MTQYNGPQDPTRWDRRQPPSWSGQPPRADGPYPPVPPGPTPKQRNWFARHKILTGLFGLIAVIVIATATSAGGRSAPQADASAAAASQPAPSTTTSAATSGRPAARKSTANATPKATKQAAPTPGIGTPVTSGDLQFTVTKVVRNQRQVGQDFMAQRAQGRYTLVYVTVRNVGSDSQTFFDDDQKIKDADNKTYSPDSTAEVAMENNDVWLSDINPGNAVDGVLVYDMPVGVRATAIEFSGGLFDDARTVQLR